MKYLRNSFVFLMMVGFSVVSFSVFTYAFQTNQAVENAKPAEPSEIVVAVTNGRIRSEPNLNGKIVKESTIGKRFVVLEEKNGWSKVEVKKAVENDDAETGWIANSITAKFDSAKPGVIYQEITDKYLKKESLNFNTAKEIFEFLPDAANEAKTFEVGGDLRLKRLMMLSNVLKSIPPDKMKNSPYKDFLERYKDEIAYSDPAGTWFVRSDKFWQLHQRYKDYKIGEEIAWEAARNPIPGECEGYINCYLYALRVTNGEYLNFYPNGTHSRKALLDVNNLLQPIVVDLPAKAIYYTTSDISDRAEFNRILSELRKIISNTPHLEKQKVLKQIDQIAEGHR